MLFKVSRASDRGKEGPGCVGQFKMTHDGYELGSAESLHPEIMAFFVQINSLEELVTFCRAEGDRVVLSTDFVRDGVHDLTVYDDYME